MSINLEKRKIIPISLSIITLLIVIISIVNIVYIKKVSDRLTLLENKFSSTTKELSDSIDKNHTTLSSSLDQQKVNVSFLEQKLGIYQKEVGSFTTTVSTLEKLRKTDPVLLAKYSKVFFLNENYAPPRFAEIPSKYKYSNSKDLKVNEQVWPFLQKMIDRADGFNVKIYVQSAYRSFNEQGALKGQYSVIYGSGSANQFSADQGYSEHQLGTTVDLITTGLGGDLEGFEKTKAYEWLTNNAYKYGFILSYPKDNKFYIFEPWHWRFVGVKLATYLHDKNKNFYDMEQRDIDEYLVSIFD
jgi:LAS superfamily LD-carboxypeptidase LdcB